MKIACVGWGSLVWNPGSLPIRRGWYKDGPLLPIEFARESSGGRITLVLVKGAPAVRSLWALLSTTDLDAAMEALRDREGIPSRNGSEHIGVFSRAGLSSGTGAPTIGHWVERKDLDAAVWTDLPPGLKGKRKEVPTADEIVAYLRLVSPEERRNAEEYVRRAPLQVDTDVRRRLELEFGWAPKRTD